MKFVQTECILCNPQIPKKHDLYQCLGCKANYQLKGKHPFKIIKYLILTTLIILSLIFTYMYQTSDHQGLFMKYRYLKFGVSIGLMAPILFGVMELFKKFRNAKSVYCVRKLNEVEFKQKNNKSRNFFVIQILSLGFISFIFTKYMVIPYFHITKLVNESTFYNQ